MPQHSDAPLDPEQHACDAGVVEDVPAGLQPADALATRQRAIRLFGARGIASGPGLLRPTGPQGSAATGRGGVRLTRRRGPGIRLFGWVLAAGAAGAVAALAMPSARAQSAEVAAPPVDGAVPAPPADGALRALPAAGAGSALHAPSLARAAESTAPELQRGIALEAGAPPMRPAAAPRAMVPATVRDALARAGIADDEYGLVVRPLGNGQLSAGHNAELPLHPASTMKLVTTSAALALLGPDYRWVTSLYTSAPVQDGMLLGDLILKGGGDPRFLVEDMRQLVRNLQDLGLREIHGDLLIDDSLYAVGPERMASFDGDELAPYNVTPYAALMNFKATRFEFDPALRQLTMDPPLADVQVENLVRITRGRCAGGALAVADSSSAEVALLRVSGQVSGRCGFWRQYGAALSHRQFIHGLFKASWLQAGGRWNGATRVRPGAATGTPYYQWRSPGTLADIALDVNKRSNNVMARMLLLQIAAQTLARPASLEDARRIVVQYFRNQGLPMKSLVLDNGSGLSRMERISAADLTAVLMHANDRSDAALFESSLPQVGVDGTMKSRLRHAPVQGNAFIKTGTLHDVRTIAGYVTAASGQRYALTLLVNGPRAEGARRAQDELLTWVFDNG